MVVPLLSEEVLISDGRVEYVELEGRPVRGVVGV